MNLISGVDVTAGALNSQKTRLDIIAQNIANAQTTRGPDGKPYQRQIVSFETELIKHQGSTSASSSLKGVRVAGVSVDRTPGSTIYDPQHPDANSEGMVTMPHVNIAYAMVDFTSTSRSNYPILPTVQNSPHT